MKQIIILLVGCLFLISCSSDSDKVNPSELVDIGVDLVRLDKNGTNTFLSSSINPIDASTIKTFYLKDGNKVEVDNPDMEASKGVVLNEVNGNKYLRVFLYPGTVDQELTSTYLQWNANEIDTLKALMSRQEGSVFISKLWHNGGLVYEAGKSQGVSWNGALFERLITIQR